MNVDGSGLERLSPESAESIHPTWSPDIRQVIYCADDDLHPPKKNDASIYSVDLQSKVTKTLITGGVNTYPSWSPDGKHIAFRRMIGDMNSEVFVANGDGSDPRNVSNHMAFDGWPAWSPDGKQIAFSSNRRANYQIHITNANGSGVRLVSNTEGRATEPRWSPDGKTIYFTNCVKVDFGVDCEQWWRLSGTGDRRWPCGCGCPQNFNRAPAVERGYDAANNLPFPPSPRYQ